MANTPPDPQALDVPVAIPVEGPGGDDVPMALPVATPAEAEPAAAPATFRCPACTSKGPAGQAFCGDCGYYFSPADLAAGAPGAEAAPPAAPVRLKDRYELRELISDRLGVQRYRAIDRGEDGAQAVPVVIVRQALPPA